MRTNGHDAEIATLSLKGRLPIPVDDRPYHSYYVGIAVFFSFGVATWGFLTGGFLGDLASAPLGMAAFFGGQALGIGVGAFSVGLICNRYGIEMIDGIKGAFGPRASRVVLAASLVNFLGWTYLLMVLSGQSIENIAKSLFGISDSSTVVAFGCAAVFIITILFASRGPKALASLASWIAPSLVIISLVMFGLLINRFGLSAMLQMKPEVAPDAVQTNYFLILEYGLAFGLSYWVTMGAITRLFPRARVATVSVMTGWGILSTIVIAVSMFAALALGSADPTEWMIPLAGNIGGVVALCFVVVANVSSMVGMLYILGVQAQQIQVFRRLSFRSLIILLATPGAILFTLNSDLLMDNYGVFLGYNAVIFAPVAAVVFVDYLILRQQHLSLRDLFNENATGAYWFWRGINPAAVIAVGIGCWLYVEIFNPVTGEANSLFKYTTATVPTLVVVGVVYYLLVRFVVMPAGWGTYGKQSVLSKQAATQPSE